MILELLDAPGSSVSRSATSPRRRKRKAGIQRELAALSWIERIRDAIDEARLVLPTSSSITETALMHDIAAGETFAYGIAEIGCGLALDDFGTGFGGFTYLKRLPVSNIKIDIEFVRDLATNTANRHVVKAIVSLAHAFGLETVAEGVEEADSLAVLRAEDVNHAQGGNSTLDPARPTNVTPLKASKRADCGVRPLLSWTTTSTGPVLAGTGRRGPGADAAAPR